MLIKEVFQVNLEDMNMKKATQWCLKEMKQTLKQNQQEIQLQLQNFFELEKLQLF